MKIKNRKAKDPRKKFFCLQQDQMENLFFDTHCNIPNILSQLKLSTYKDLKPLLPKEYGGCVSVASDAASQKSTLELISNEEEVFGAFAIHPLYAEEYTEECEKNILEAMKNPKTVAWGEIGLDYHIFKDHNYAKPELQKKIFVQQMQHAIRLKKPIVIHTREAEEDTYTMMKEYIPSDWKIHVHCFTDTLPFALKLINEWKNLYIGFTGVITFKNSTELQKVVKEIPLDRLLLETDGPFMAPVPHRGKPAHPGYIPLIAQQIAQLKQISVQQVYSATLRNTKLMYGIPFL